MGSGWEVGPGSVMVVLCLCELSTWILYVDSRSRYLYIAIGGYMCILCAPYQYLLPTVYLFVGDIANPDLFTCGCRTWICLNISDLMRSSVCHPAGPHGRPAKKEGKYT